MPPLDEFHLQQHENLETRLSRVEDFFPKLAGDIADLRARIYLSGTIAGAIVGVIIALAK